MKIARDAVVILLMAWVLVCATIVNVDAHSRPRPHIPVAPCTSFYCLPQGELFVPYTSWSPRAR